MKRKKKREGKEGEVGERERENWAITHKKRLKEKSVLTEE